MVTFHPDEQKTVGSVHAANGHPAEYGGCDDTGESDWSCLENGATPAAMLKPGQFFCTDSWAPSATRALLSNQRVSPTDLIKAIYLDFQTGADTRQTLPAAVLESCARHLLAMDDVTHVDVRS